MNWDCVATALSASDVEFAAAASGAAEPPGAAARADSQWPERTEATTRKERQRGTFTAGFL